MTALAIESIREAAGRVRENIGRVIVGKEDALNQVLVALLCQGHILVEDVPGIGKTTLAKAVALSLGCTFRRIQFTPDLMPSDITGINYYNQRIGEFQFRPGPLMAQIVLGDEINRATPRTQSALLEAMEERQVTVDGETMPLPRPFLVLATQNPVELEGTFPLPEAQLDRFLLRIRLGYPNELEEQFLLRRFEEESPLDDLEPVLSSEDLISMQVTVRRVHVDDSLREYVVRLCRATRAHTSVDLGASPRATLSLFRAARAKAALAGRDFVIPDDIKEMAIPVLAHRIMLSAQTRLRGRSAGTVIEELLQTVPVPIET